MNVAGPGLVVTMSHLPPPVGILYSASFALVLASKHVFVFLIDAYGALVIPYVLASSPVVHNEAKAQPTSWLSHFFVPAYYSFRLQGGCYPRSLYLT
jgi:hypothetical protein